MPLKLPKEWLYGSPGELDSRLIGAFDNLIEDIARQGDRWPILELFKQKFSPGCGTSSNESWATSDLFRAMETAIENGPKFVAAFWIGCEEVRHQYPDITLPDASIINGILASHGAPYEIIFPNLVTRDMQPMVQVIAPEQTVDESARELIQESLDQADRFLAERRPRPAVQEILWLLETVSTAFQGLDSGNGTVEGRYFNEIIRDLRKHNGGTTLREILGWINTLHGFLSSPSGGGVRHGTELSENASPSLAQAQLYCNLTKSYINYLLVELAVLRRDR